MRDEIENNQPSHDQLSVSQLTISSSTILSILSVSQLTILSEIDQRPISYQPTTPLKPNICKMRW